MSIETPTKTGQDNEWLACQEEIRGLNTKFIQLAQIRGVLGMAWYHHEISAFAEVLKQNGLDPYTCIAFHRLIGSGASQKYAPILDFPHPYSIKDFIESKIKELEKREELDLKNIPPAMLEKIKDKI